MSKNKKLIPELCFPEFAKSAEWEVKTLGKVCDIIKGEQLNRIELTEKGKYPCQNGGVNPSGFTDKFNSEENTITISEGGNSCGYVNFITSKFWLGGHCYKLKTNKKVDTLFLFQALKHNEEKIMRLRVGSGLPNIQLNAIRNFEFVICNSLPEQQKIASCLSALDEVIVAHSQKLDLLKDHKKGLMQNLFPQEGEKVPKLRFKVFEKDGEWVEKTLGDVVKYFKGFAFQSKDYTSKGRRIIRVSDMGFNYIKNEDNAIYINEGDAVQYEKWKLKKNDLIITTVGSKPPMYDSLVGRTIIVESKDENALLNQNAPDLFKLGQQVNFS
ncbi:restriction endonuclease subunit S [Emticicia sp. 21SJ11W-3]|uniref:restriction endonuclease subunit S n=1 Tax=Emticicia sp. 21SJ11W-3 TaxID=2916755 RepID=UPI0020A1B288|nr:restriction endonuclease subunit S [Emticicia sp. 21SJ11W-3]UTA67266.1 restriction endonuclease subunit S [Emticicia sp. 21SJ11W-3]